MTAYRAGEQPALPFDPDDPPEQPPAGADPMTWRMAYRIFLDHRPGSDGRCLAATCEAAGASWPCPAAGLARAGFVDACRDAATGGDPAGGAGTRAA